MFRFIAGLSWPGSPDKANDDAFCHSDRLGAVFDGATSLGEGLLPVDSDAAWIARRGAQGLISHQELGAREALKRTAADAERDFIALRARPPREMYEVPLASMMLAAIAEAAIEFLWFGDCCALVRVPGETVDVIGDALESRTAESHRVARLAETHKLNPASGVNRPEYLQVLRRARNHVNSRDDRWAFTPDARCAAHANSKSIEAFIGTDILLCSDGFLALASDYRRYDAQGLLDAALRRGLTPLFEELRAIERDDPDGTMFPRFKTSDDATAIILRVERTSSP